LGLIEGLEMSLEGVLGGGVFVKPQGIIEIAHEEGLHSHILLAGLVAALHDLEANGVTVGLLHDQARHLEEGISATTELDLTGQGADAALFRGECQFNGNQRLRTEIRTTRAATRSVAAGAALGIPSDAGTSIAAGPALRPRATVAARSTL
jgi:hypothetical protein